jgi:NADH:ubiquinone oxidoreductase subunit E
VHTNLNIKERKCQSVATIYVYIRSAHVKVGLINLCKGLFNLNARIYYKLKSGT